jgi:hypothetical protein
MDFEQIILDEIEYIDDHYSDTYTSTHRVYRFSVEHTFHSYSDLPSDLRDAIAHYYQSYWDSSGTPTVRAFLNCEFTHTENFYYEANWIVDPEPPPPDPPPDPRPEPDPGDPKLFSASYFTASAATGGHWEYGPDIFCGGTYSGLVTYAGDGCDWQWVVVDVKASGPTRDGDGKTEVDSIDLHQQGAGGIYAQKQKVDGEWQEPIVGRNPYRTGGLWTDPGVKADYEYDSSWPGLHYEASGSIHSNGEYIYVNSIPTGSGWHGPSFIRTLPSYFKVEDLGSFSANLSLVHGNNGYRMSTTSVSLFDENKRIVASLMITDAWGYNSIDAQKQYFTATYYFEDGSYRSYSSNYYTGDTSGVVIIRYDPLSGVFGDIPGKTEKFLFVHNQVNPNRIIKYIAVQSYRYSNLDEHDERIYNIRLSYAGSEYTVFHDNCNDMDGFHEDNDFGWGVTAPGEFVVPDDQSYMQVQSIPNSPSGWHGPNFVHVLDRPFRLYQLSEFSVIGQLIQSSMTMGKTYVALFDENKQIVMLIHWGDSWAFSKKAYFNVYFYPQNGGSYYQASGYIYNSGFTKTGKLWWGEGVGGDGAIYSSIDGSGDADPIGECDNASRVIKYVVLLGYKYSHYNLVDMRIHDINVEANLAALNPNAPSPYDGTDLGVGETAPPPQDEWPSKVISWWTWPWPELHSRIEESHPEGISVTAQIKTDLLGFLTIETLSVNDNEGGTIENLSDAVIDITVQLLIDKLAIAIGLLLVEFMWKIACIASNTNPSWLIPATLLGIDWLILYSYSVAVFEASLRNSGYDPLLRFWVLVVTGLIFAFGAFLLDFGAKVVAALVVGKDVTDMLLGHLPGGFVLLVFKLLALIPLMTYAVATLFAG